MAVGMATPAQTLDRARPQADQAWPRLCALAPPALFVWGRHDRLVPLAFGRHVGDTLPSARQLELPCGHVPQIELPARTNEALARFFAPLRRDR